MMIPNQNSLWGLAFLFQFTNNSLQVGKRAVQTQLASLLFPLPLTDPLSGVIIHLIDISIIGGAPWIEPNEKS